MVGQGPAVAMHLAIWYGELVFHRYAVCKKYVGSMYVNGYGGLSESEVCVYVFRELCPVGPPLPCATYRGTHSGEVV